MKVPQLVLSITLPLPLLLFLLLLLLLRVQLHATETRVTSGTRTHTVAWKTFKKRDKVALSRCEQCSLV